jgi:hypothetical protein
MDARHRKNQRRGAETSQPSHRRKWDTDHHTRGSRRSRCRSDRHHLLIGSSLRTQVFVPPTRSTGRRACGAPAPPVPVILSTATPRGGACSWKDGGIKKPVILSEGVRRPSRRISRGLVGRCNNSSLPTLRRPFDSAASKAAPLRVTWGLSLGAREASRRIPRSSER